MKQYEKCGLCPRQCKVNRQAGQTGVCGVESTLKIARAALHYWEEPCISGKNGSGAVFFSGCSLGCIFCQNKEIARGTLGKEISHERLAEIFLELQEQGANNINLVTAGHYVPHVVKSVESSRRQGLSIPVVYNTGSYETVDNIKSLEGIVDVYLPDFKYMDEKLAGDFSKAPDYPQVAKLAIEEMVRQQPVPVFVESPQNEEGGLIQKGVIVRQLLLPGHVKDAKRITDYLHNKYGNRIYISMMSQYTPLAPVEKYKELNRRVTGREYDSFIDYAIEIGVEQGFFQENKVALESFIPHFDGSGV